ncbi:hypothetical protein B0E53_04709 [Micromonospora sp. MH33]|nr:hypothetical protein B0E53_04709 [Micromonospora sp. MH33]
MTCRNWVAADCATRRAAPSWTGSGPAAPAGAENAASASTERW